MSASLFEYLKNTDKKTLSILSKDSKEALDFADTASYLGFAPFVLPDFRGVCGDDLRSFKEEISALFVALDAFFSSKKHKKILISPYKTLRNQLPIS